MRRLVAVAATVAVLLGVGALAVAFGSGPFLARHLEARLEEATGYRWTVALRAGATLRPAPGLVLHDVEARVDLERGAVARVRVPEARLFGSLAEWGARAQLERVELDGPTLELPRDLWRYLRTRAADRSWRLDGVTGPGRVVVQKASVLLTAEGAEPRRAASGLDVEAVVDPRTRSLGLKAHGRVGGEELRSDLVVDAASGPGASPASARFTVAFPRAPAFAVTGSAEVAAEGPVVTLSRLSGSVGPNRFTGALVLDLTAKPMIRLDLGFPVLALGPGAGAASSGAGADWTLTADGFDALRDFDARLKLYVGTLEAGALSLADVAGEAQAKDGIVTLTLGRAALYGGEAQGSLTLTPGSPAPAHVLRARVKDARALPLLAAAADFTLLDGTVSAGLDLRGTGWNSADLARTLSGDAEIEARQGRINNVNLSLLAQMLSSRPPAGQDPGGAGTGATAFERFSARFRLEGGRATTGDMVLRGPVVEATGSGVVDVAEKTLAFRINPRLSAGTSSVAAMVAGLTVPVVVEGPWASPRAYPDFGGRSAPSGSAPAADPLGGLLGKGGLGALLDAIVPNLMPQRECEPNCPRGDEAPVGPRRPGAAPSGRP